MGLANLEPCSEMSSRSTSDCGSASADLIMEHWAIPYSPPRPLEQQEITIEAECPAVIDNSSLADSLTGGRDQELPSLGSELHASGECKPCAWFWKPQGCKNGKDCLHCHMCTEGELKTRKKKKVEALRNETNSAPELKETKQSDAEDHVHNMDCAQGDDEVDEQYYLQNEVASEKDLPSIGSLLHASGQCKPCAWFWKVNSCQNGRACCHCHLCPSDELKSRKKARAAAQRALDAHAQYVNTVAQSLTMYKEPWPCVAPISQILDFGVSPGLVDEDLVLPPIAPQINEPLVPPGLADDSMAWPSPPGLADEDLVLPPVAPQLHEPPVPPGLADEDLVLPPVVPQIHEPPVPPGLADDSIAWPSVGSSLHGSGQCKPCAWFWKPQGCANGQLCNHCHLCPEGEIKARKAAKITSIRADAEGETGHSSEKKGLPSPANFELDVVTGLKANRLALQHGVPPVHMRSGKLLPTLL